MSENQSVMKDPEGIPVFEDAIAKVVKRKCIDPKHRMRCKWATMSGKYCRRKTFANRMPKMMTNDHGEDTICELFKVGKPGCKINGQ